VTPEIDARIRREVIEPTLAGMAADGAPFTGFLYAGLMIGRDGTPKVLEFNVRFGDPETQPIMLRLRSDLVDLIEAALAGRLDSARAEWDPRPALGVVLAAPGYPEAPRTGLPIEGLPATAADTHVFHAGTRLDGDRLVTAGGRVLTCCALGRDLREARDRAYRLIGSIESEGAFYRRDIGAKALAREA
jgi:phosphoribosylamine--glycine ligase